MIGSWCANTAWMLAGWSEAAAFSHAMQDSAAAQERVLRDIVRANRSSDFGRKHGFDRIGTVADYQQRVPTRDYDGFAPYIDRIAAGEAGVLTTEPVTSLQPTGGSSGGRKLIPYTRSLQLQFQRALRVWIADLFAKCPEVRRGRAYWSITPAGAEAARTSGGVAIGFEDDTAYLGPWARRVARRMLVAPNWLARVADLETFRYLTLLHLLAAEDLSLVSVWSPTYLSGLLDDCLRWQDRLVDLLAAGAWPPKSCTSLPDYASPPASLRERQRRGQYLHDVFKSINEPRALWQAIWPDLSLVSCWADAAASGPFETLSQQLPGVTFQPKGLLATEGFVSLPLWDRPAAALAVRSHFFEFFERGASLDIGKPKLAHQLDVGGRYEIVLTTGGGLYRFRLGDEIVVMDRMGTCPLVELVGRIDGTSDLVGEKLSTAHVQAVLDRVWTQLGVRPSFSLLTAVTGQSPRYCLYVQDRRLTVECLPDLAHALERGLSENPYYAHAVGMRQLAPGEVVLLDPAGLDAWQLYVAHRLAAGQRLGDIKPAAFDPSFPAAEILDRLRMAHAACGDVPSAHKTMPALRLPQGRLRDADESATSRS